MKRLLSLFSVVAIVLSLASCSSTSSREVVFRAKLINYSAVTYSFYPSTDVYLVTVDSAYHSSDTILWNNERYVLLERAK